MTPRSLSAAAVELQTTTVDIKVMRVGTRQMTQAVFRQLPSECPFMVDADGTTTLRGRIWGHVRYFPERFPDGSQDNDDTRAEWINLVWQKEATLARYLLHRSEVFCSANQVRDELRDRVYGAVALFCDPKPWPATRSATGEELHSPVVARGLCNGVARELRVSSYRALSNWASDHGVMLDALPARISAPRVRCVAGLDADTQFDGAETAVRATESRFNDLVCAAHDTWNWLTDTDQLFIAV